MMPRSARGVHRNDDSPRQLSPQARRDREHHFGESLARIIHHRVTENTEKFEEHNELQRILVGQNYDSVFLPILVFSVLSVTLWLVD